VAIGTDSMLGALPDKSDPFRIDVPITLPLHRRVALAAARPFLTWTLALNTYRDLYHRAHHAPGTTFCARALHTLGIRVNVTREEVSSLPACGGLIVVANHPHGIIDGLALADAVHQRRHDVRLVANHLLAQIPELSELCLFVDPFGGHQAAARSHAGLRAALQWLRDGHALILFPAGTVASTFVSGAATPTDAEWSDTVGRLALRSGAAVVPAFIEGRNSRWFYRAGRLHPGLRSLLLARELLRQRGSSVTIRIGDPIAIAACMTESADGTRATALIRAEVERLATVSARPVTKPQPRLIGPPVTALLEAEIHALNADECLVESGPLQVFCAHAPNIPVVLQDIGRLREETFRAVGEGTGRAIDLDRFDQHYAHLFVWNRDRRELVGAYRLGLTDQILASHGLNGLYTSTLFRYDARLLMRLSPAIELGRSFVRAEYQRSSNALSLLWKGIARFVARSGRYRVLFGPVSISSRYTDTSQQLLRCFLAQNFYHRELGALVEAVRSPSSVPLPAGIDPSMVADMHDVDQLVARLEADGKGIPVLLRQYLRLNAKLLGFNVDPAFGDTLDALMMVDLADVNPGILTRYFGKQEAEQLLARSSSMRWRQAAA